MILRKRFWERNVVPLLLSGWIRSAKITTIRETVSNGTRKTSFALQPRGL